MSDRVAIIGGSTVGRDHFPFPVVDKTEDQIYPIGISLEDAAKSFFKVRTWQIEVDITIEGSGDPEADPPVPDTHLEATYYAEAGAVIFNGVPPVDAPEAYERESDLVVPRETFSTDDSTTSNFVIFCSEEDDFFPAGERMSFEDDTFYPALYCDADAAVSTANDAFGSGASGTVLHFLDYEMTLFGDENHVGTITVTPLEYWPYATKDGLPVYDTSTGAQLRDPFS